jgi:Flp pilus assembly protein TadD
MQTNELSGPAAVPSPRSEAVNPRIDATTYFAHGHLLERQGSFERAVKQYRDALKAMPDFLTARNRLGITLNKLGRNHEASAEFRRAIALRPRAAYLHNNLGFSLYLEGKYGEAEVATRRALEIKSSFPRARMNHALALAKLERFDEAFDELCRAGSEANAYYNMAMLQTEAGHYADAARSLDMALRLNPELEAARQQLREIDLLAARQETVPVADAAAEPDAEQPGQTLPAAEPYESHMLAEAEEAIPIVEVTTDEWPERAEVAEPAEQPQVAELPAEPVVAELPADADETETLAEVDAVELAGEAEVVFEPRPAPDLAEFFGEPQPPEWSGEPEPAEPLAEVELFDEPQEADLLEPTTEAADEIDPSLHEIVPSAWHTPADRPLDAESAIEMINELITAIVNRSEALVAELWCELEAYREAAEQQEQQSPEPLELPEY